MAIIGYARIRLSEGKQAEVLQRDALALFKCDYVYCDRVVGSKPELPELDAAMARLKVDDTLVIWKLDRLSRTLSHLIHTVCELNDRGISLKSIQEGIEIAPSPSSAESRIFKTIADFDNELARVRARRALDVAITTNSLVGRKPVITQEKLTLAKNYLKSGNSVREAAQRLNIGKTVLYSALKKDKLTAL